ncbi:hypothetical protein [Pontibacter flavimaris]|nr:hypothetical protein [Pontibacter flavimaris]
MEDALIVKLNESQRNELVSYYRGKLNELESQANNYRDLLRQLTSPSGESNYVESNHAPIAKPIYVPAPSQASVFTDNPEHSAAIKDYKQTWSWSMKIKYVIASNGRCLTSREIVDQLSLFDTSLTKVADPMSSVSGSISAKISKGVIFDRYRPYDGAEYYTGLKEWFDEDGELIDENHRGSE